MNIYNVYIDNYDHILIQEVKYTSSTRPSTLPPTDQHATHSDASPVGVSTGQWLCACINFKKELAIKFKVDKL